MRAPCNCAAPLSLGIAVVRARSITSVPCPPSPRDPGGQASLFLNSYFMQFDFWFPLFGIVSVALFAGYLLVCVISGIFKVGVRCFCMTIHPMRRGKTLMNAFMFNTMWILLCAIPVVQFCTEAFDSYARYTTIATLLGVQVPQAEDSSAV